MFDGKSFAYRILYYLGRVNNPAFGIKIKYLHEKRRRKKNTKQTNKQTRKTQKTKTKNVALKDKTTTIHQIHQHQFALPC